MNSDYIETDHLEYAFTRTVVPTHPGDELPQHDPPNDPGGRRFACGHSLMLDSNRSRRRFPESGPCPWCRTRRPIITINISPQKVWFGNSWERFPGVTVCVDTQTALQYTTPAGVWLRALHGADALLKDSGLKPSRLPGLDLSDPELPGRINRLVDALSKLGEVRCGGRYWDKVMAPVAAV